MEEEKTTSETQKSDSRPDRSQLNAFENFYEKFRKVPLKYIDVFIAEGSRPLLALQTLRENRRGGIHPSPTNRPGSRHHFLTIFFFFRTLYPKLPSFLPSAR